MTDPTEPAPAPRAQLLEVQVQPVFVVTDEHGQAHKVVLDPRTVPGADWREFGANSFDTIDLEAVAAEWAALAAAGIEP